MVVLTIFTFIIYFSLSYLKLNIHSIILRRICAISFIYASVLNYNTLYIQSIGSGIGLYSGLFQVNILSCVLSIFILLISGIITIIWPSFFNNISKKGEVNLPLALTQSKSNDKILDSANMQQAAYLWTGENTRSNEYCVIILFNILGALFLISSSDLISMYLSIELQSFGLYILTSIYRDKLSSTSAGLKYFLLGGLSSCIILLGSGLIYTYTGLTNLESIYSLISVYFDSNFISSFSVWEAGSQSINPHGVEYINLIYELKGLSLGILLIFSGFLFKIAASPFHNWAPDVYDDSPTIVTIWLTIMPKISILIFLLEILIGLDINLLLTQLTHPFIYSLTEYTGGEWGTVNILTNLLLLSSLLSLLIGSIVGLRQVRIKRLLAYSTINHIGFLLLALSVFSNYSIEAFIFYIFQYTITNLNIFLIILAFGYVSSASTLVRKRSHPCASDPFTVRERGDKTEEERLFITSDVEYISTLKGKFFENPLLSISLSISLFSFAGVPPLIGFFAKQQVLYSSNSAGYFFLSLVAILVSIISASYYLKIINVMLTPDTIHTTSSLPFFCIPTLKTGSVSEHDDYIAEAGKLNIKESENNTHTLSNLIDGTVLEDKGKLILDHTVKQNNNYIYNIKAISSAGKLSNTHSFIIGILTLSIIFFIFNPEILLNCIAIVSSLILNL